MQFFFSLRLPSRLQSACYRTALGLALMLMLTGCGGSDSGDADQNNASGGQRRGRAVPVEPQVTLDDFMIPIDSPGEWTTTETVYENPEEVWHDVLRMKRANNMAGILLLSSAESREWYLPTLIDLLNEIKSIDRSLINEVKALVAEHLGDDFDLEVYAAAVNDEGTDFDDLVERTVAMLADPQTFMAEAMHLFNRAAEDTDYEYDLGGIRNIQIDEGYAEAEHQVIYGDTIRFEEWEPVEFIKDDEGWLLLIGGSW